MNNHNETRRAYKLIFSFDVSNMKWPKTRLKKRKIFRLNIKPKYELFLRFANNYCVGYFFAIVFSSDFVGSCL